MIRTNILNNVIRKFTREELRGTVSTSPIAKYFNKQMHKGERFYWTIDGKATKEIMNCFGTRYHATFSITLDRNPSPNTRIPISSVKSSRNLSSSSSSNTEESYLLPPPLLIKEKTIEVPKEQETIVKEEIDDDVFTFTPPPPSAFIPSNSSIIIPIPLPPIVSIPIPKVIENEPDVIPEPETKPTSDHFETTSSSSGSRKREYVYEISLVVHLGMKETIQNQTDVNQVKPFLIMIQSPITPESLKAVICSHSAVKTRMKTPTDFISISKLIISMQYKRIVLADLDYPESVLALRNEDLVYVQLSPECFPSLEKSK